MKRHCWRKLASLILVMGTGTPLYAQYWFEQPQPRWRLYGDAGFDFNKTNLGTHGNAGSGTSPPFLVKCGPDVFAPSGALGQAFRRPQASPP